MVYETKQTRLTPVADLSMESIELQIEQKIELEQLQQYLKENYPEETEIPIVPLEAALEVYGGEVLYAISKNKQDAEKERKKNEEPQEEDEEQDEEQ